jgi:ADP-ribosyl-[dinitrogen reductase] hydrolase
LKRRAGWQILLDVMTTHRRFESSVLECKALAQQGILKIRWHDFLERAPQHIDADVDLPDRVEGLMLGLAVGDSLGNSSESMLPDKREATYGWVDHYLPNRHAHSQRVGLPSDDTQMAFWTLEHLLLEGGLEPQYLGAAFARREIYGIGKSVRGFLTNYKSGRPWVHAGVSSAGNGALMRIAPMVIPRVKNPGAGLWGDTLMAAHLTHNDALSNVACVAFVDLLWKLLCSKAAPDKMWWVETFAATCALVEPETPYQPRMGRPEGFSGTLSQLIRQHVVPALEADLSVTAACDRWHSGAYLLETVPCVIYILARHGHDPKAAILAAVNETKDNDTIAAIVGAAVGALHGLSALPPEWVTALLGRTESADDGRVFELLRDAGQKYGYGNSTLVASRVPVRPAVDTMRAGFAEGDPVEVLRETFWVKIVSFLQQNWAAIDDVPGTSGVRIWFFGDTSGVFDFIDYPSREAARRALHVNGFSVWTAERFDFIGKPSAPFEWRSHPNGEIYSSGRYWIIT